MNRLILFLSFVFCFLVQLYSQPYKDSRLPVDIRVDDLLGRMTLEEKIAQIRHIHGTYSMTRNWMKKNFKN